MRTILSPYHLDEQLDGPWPLAPELVLRPRIPEGTPWERIAAVVGCIADAVEQASADGEVPLLLSGDCVSALGVVAGLQRRGIAPSVVWLDGHADVQTTETSASGYLGGMPIRQLVGGADRTVPDAIGLAPVAEHDVTLLGARDIDPPEAVFLEGSAIRRGPVAPVDVEGPVVLHVDADVVSGEAVPGLLFPAPDGLSVEHVAAAMRTYRADLDIVAISLACTTTERDSSAMRAIGDAAAG